MAARLKGLQGWSVQMPQQARALLSAVACPTPSRMVCLQVTVLSVVMPFFGSIV